MAITERVAQRNTNGSASVSASIVVTYPAAPIVGNLLVAVIFSRAAVTATPAGWARAIEQIGGGGRVGIYYKVAEAGDPLVFTWTAGTVAFFAAAGSEWQGLTAWEVDKAVSGNGTTSSSASTGASGVLSDSNQLLVAGFGAPNTVVFSAHAGVAPQTQTVSSTGGIAANNATVSVAARGTSVNNSVTATANQSGTSGWAAALATFKVGVANTDTGFMAFFN